MFNQQGWYALARCRGLNDELFPEGKDQKQAKLICLGCQVRAMCLAEALDSRIEWGVWGGMTERERRQILKARPSVTSWRKVLISAENKARSQQSHTYEEIMAVLAEAEQ